MGGKPNCVYILILEQNIETQLNKEHVTTATTQHLLLLYSTVVLNITKFNITNVKRRAKPIIRASTTIGGVRLSERNPQLKCTQVNNRLCMSKGIVIRHSSLIQTLIID